MPDVPSFRRPHHSCKLYFLARYIDLLFKVDNLYNNRSGKSRRTIRIVTLCLLFDLDPLDCRCFGSDEGFIHILILLSSHIEHLFYIPAMFKDLFSFFQWRKVLQKVKFLGVVSNQQFAANIPGFQTLS